MTTVSQILDRTQSQPERERRDFKPEWRTVHTFVVKQDGSLIEGVQGFALDEYEHCVVAEVRKSNNFPLPRYEVLTGIRRRGRTMVGVGLRTTTQADGAVSMDLGVLDHLQIGTRKAAEWAQNDLAQEAQRPNVKKALQFRIQRAKDEELGVDGVSSQKNSNAGHSRVGKTERDRAKKQKPTGK